MSRRKQFKPKLFGANEPGESTGDANNGTFVEEQVDETRNQQHQQPIEDTQSNNDDIPFAVNDLKRKRDAVDGDEMPPNDVVGDDIKDEFIEQDELRSGVDQNEQLDDTDVHLQKKLNLQIDNEQDAAQSNPIDNNNDVITLDTNSTGRESSVEQFNTLDEEDLSNEDGDDDDDGGEFDDEGEYVDGDGDLTESLNLTDYKNEYMQFAMGQANMQGDPTVSRSFNYNPRSRRTANPLGLPLICKICNKTFKHKRSLNRHIKLHSGEKNYQCPYCASAFARSDHLRSHVKTHDNSFDKPFKCPICQCGYNTLAALKVHTSHNHAKSKYKCELCNDLEFHSLLALEGHIYNAHTIKNDNANTDSLMNNTDNTLSDISNNNNNQNNMNKSALNYSNTNGEMQLDQNNKINGQNEPDIKQEIEPGQVIVNNQILAENNNNNNNNNCKQDDSAQGGNKFIKIAPKYPNSQILQQLLPNATSSPYQPSKTFCEMCNAKFLNAESFQAHMRNCHPHIYASQNHQNNQQLAPPRMSVLSNILSKPQPPIQIPPPQQQQHQIPPRTKCMVPSCNCSNSVNHLNGPPSNGVDMMMSNGKVDETLIIRETHFTCVQCNLTFLKLNDYMVHLKQMHCVEVYRCILCKQMQLFDNLNLLKDHFFQVHQSHKYDLFRCRLCLNQPNLVFHHINDLYNHLHNVHNQDSKTNQGYHYPSQQAAPYLNGSSPSIPHHPPAPQRNDRFHFNSNTHGSNNVPTITSVQPSNPNNSITNISSINSSKSLKCNICDRVCDSEESLAQHKFQHTKALNVNGISNNNSSSGSLNKMGENNPNSSFIDAKSNTAPVDSKPSQTNNSNIPHKPTITPVASQSVNNNSTTTLAVCVFCKQTIENQIQFKEHFKRHNNIGVNNNQPNQANVKPSFKCIVCSQTLSSNNEYNTHMKNHLRRVNQANPQPSTATQPTHQHHQQNGGSTNIANPNKFRCMKCSECFEIKQDLVNHVIQVHKINLTVIARPSQPPSQQQNTNAINSNHVNRISSLSNIECICEICSRKFDSDAKLQAHLLLKHEFVSTNGVLTCPVCDDSSFTRPDYLLTHTQSHGQAAKIYKCTDCTHAFVFKSQLINHSFVHQFGSNVGNNNSSANLKQLGSMRSTQHSSVINSELSRLNQELENDLQQEMCQLINDNSNGFMSNGHDTNGNNDDEIIISDDYDEHHNQYELANGGGKEQYTDCY